MKATTKMEATRIAEAGARKMTGLGYTFRLFPMSRTTGYVFNPDRTRYAVNTYVASAGRGRSGRA